MHSADNSHQAVRITGFFTILMVTRIKLYMLMKQCALHRSKAIA